MLKLTLCAIQQPPVANASTNIAKIEIDPGKNVRQIEAADKKTRQIEDKEVLTSNRHHFSLTRNHNGHVPGKQWIISHF